ncbi:MAG TPA: PIN domain-containing protein [Candidatus Saccharimonadales bacterium]|jgi:predicted nucleic acid-binding protein
MEFLDTNIILRYLLGDHKVLSTKAEELITRSKTSSLLIADVIVAEIVYVLRGTGRDYDQVGEALLLIGRIDSIRYENEELVMQIIKLLKGTKLDFADCYLLARARREKLGLQTFDKSLEKHYQS